MSTARPIDGPDDDDVEREDWRGRRLVTEAESVGTRSSVPRLGALRCLAAAILFGASAPAASVLAGDMPTLVLAGLLYVGAALAVLPTVARNRPTTAALRAGGSHLVLAVVFGGTIGPALLVAGLERISAATASLLLNFELVATVALAALVFGEHLGRRLLVAAALVGVAAALLIGALGYGVSITLWVKCARDLGAARGQVIFATAPFVGAVLSWTLLGESLTAVQALSVPLAAIGVGLSLRTAHDHVHRHLPVEHEHEHSHDDGHHDHHHTHAGPARRHVHRHRHESVEHAHPHVPDLHHVHSH